MPSHTAIQSAGHRQSPSVHAPKSRGPSVYNLGKLALGALAMLGGAAAQSGTFLGGTVVPDLGGARGGPRPPAPPAQSPRGAFTPAFAPVAAPSPASSPGGAVAANTESMLAHLPAPPSPPSLGGAWHGSLGVSHSTGYRASSDSRQLLEGESLVTTTKLNGLVPVKLYGCPSADYSGFITVGGQQLAAIMDTGSSALVVASNLCTDCKVTASYKLSANGRDLQTPVSLAYGSAQVIGDEVQDTVAVGSGPSTALILADATEQEGLFNPNNCVYNVSLPANNQALMGMGRNVEPTDDTQTYITQILPQLYFPAVSFALCDINGMMFLGGYPANNVTQTPFFTPLATPTASPYLAVGMQSLTVGKTHIGATLRDFGYTVVDTGTSGLALPTAVYQAVLKTIAQTAPGLSTVFTQPDCLRMPAGTTVTQVNAAAPSLTFGFYNGQSPVNNVSVPATNSYLQAKYDAKNALYLCSLIGDGGSQTILGNSVMRNLMVIFDFQNQQVGFAPSSGICAA